jgi:hypothetical protein
MATAAKKMSLAASLVAAQSELHAPAKNRTVNVPGKYKFDYATLDEITERVLRPVLPKHGLWFVQGVKDGHMVTTILHEGGETFDAGHLPMPTPANARPQEAGSLVTYYKRYSLCAAFGLVADEDDDGTAASGETFQTSARKPANVNGKAAKRDEPFPQGPAKNKTELKSIGREFWRQVEGCGDTDELEALLRSHADLTKQLAEALPSWWNGGQRDGEPFEGLAEVISRKQTELASDDWRGNVLNGG